MKRDETMTEQRNTIQKTLIFSAVRELHHPTADEIYHAVAKEHPNISKGTVYRNLKTMTEQGRIQQIKNSDGPDYFDHMVQVHYHCKCLKCRKIFDADLPYMEELNGKVTACGDFLAEDHEIIFTGLCPQCK